MLLQLLELLFVEETRVLLHDLVGTNVAVVTLAPGDVHLRHGMSGGGGGGGGRGDDGVSLRDVEHAVRLALPDMTGSEATTAGVNLSFLPSDSGVMPSIIPDDTPSSSCARRAAIRWSVLHVEDLFNALRTLKLSSLRCDPFQDLRLLLLEMNLPKQRHKLWFCLQLLLIRPFEGVLQQR